jgi:hypothetical protein
MTICSNNKTYQISRVEENATLATNYIYNQISTTISSVTHAGAVHMS